MKYFITLNNQTVGPMTVDQMMVYPINADTPVCQEGGEWKPLYSYPELMSAMHLSGKTSQINSDLSQKKTLCGIMAILFGTLGVQYFILGKTAGGLLTILISVVTCGLWSVVMLIQGILMLCMTDADFKKKYVDSTSALPLF
ncbi:MAG: GYF domain-containing protein [Muribaculaceae bacterium]|nr:GYF domain-containing protein [Muribaculaceae bacterium]